MQNIPTRIKSMIPVKEILAAENWWNKLSEENQYDLKELYDEDSRSDSGTVSIYLCGKFVEQETKNEDSMFWINYFYDYIVNHELVIDEYKVHHGGICSRTKAAENAIRAGKLDNKFECPLNNCNCQMKKIINLNQNKVLEFYIKFKLD